MIIKEEITDDGLVMMRTTWFDNCDFPMREWCAIGRFTPWPLPKFTGRLCKLRGEDVKDDGGFERHLDQLGYHS